MIPYAMVYQMVLLQGTFDLKYTQMSRSHQFLHNSWFNSFFNQDSPSGLMIIMWEDQAKSHLYFYLLQVCITSSPVAIQYWEL